MKVSIITCTYNRPHLLKRSIKSVLKQNFKNWELLIIDDGSKRKTALTVKKFKDKRIKYFYKKNTGLFDSINFALQKIKGQYIAFCDDDDILLPNKLSQQVSFLEKNPQIAACFSDFLLKKGKTTKKVNLFGKDNNFLFNMYYESFLVNNCFLLKSKFFKKEKFDTNIIASCEHEWLLRVSSKYSFKYCSGEPVAIYNRHKSNMTNKTQSMNIMIEIVKKNYLLNKKKFSKKERKILEASILFREGKYFFWQHNYKMSRKKFIESIKKNVKQTNSFIFLPFTFLGEKSFNLLIPLYEFLTGKIHIKDTS